MTPTRIDLVIELDEGARPLRGLVRDQTGDLSPFVGWLGLAHAIARALAADDGPDTARRQPKSSGLLPDANVTTTPQSSS